MGFDGPLRNMIPCAVLMLLAPSMQGQQRKTVTSAATRSAAVTNVHYNLTLDSATASRRTIQVAMSFAVAGPGPVLLSLPAWTPGAYEISNFAL